jgi:hypothetical protein
MNSRKENFGEALYTVLANQPPDRVGELERKVTQLQKAIKCCVLSSGAVSRPEIRKNSKGGVLCTQMRGKATVSDRESLLLLKHPRHNLC